MSHYFPVTFVHDQRIVHEHKNPHHPSDESTRCGEVPTGVISFLKSSDLYCGHCLIEEKD